MIIGEGIGDNLVTFAEKKKRKEKLSEGEEEEKVEKKAYI